MKALITSKHTYFGAQYSEANQKKFMAKAQKVSLDSTCERNNTGVVIVSPKGRVVGKGRSFTPDGVLSCKVIGAGCLRNKFNISSGTGYDKSCLNIHAEERALWDAGKIKSKNGTLFLFGHHFLCDGCKIRVINAGIEDVYIQNKSSESIKHYSIKEIISQINDNFKVGLDSLVKASGKTLI